MPVSDLEAKRIVAGQRDGLPEVLQALKSTAGDQATVVIPPESGLFLTASEFRALKSTAEQVGVTVTVETDDRLRRQLAQMFTVEWQPLPVTAPVAKTPTAWPTRQTEGAPESNDELESERAPEPDDRIELTTSKPWRTEVINASRETALPPPPSMKPEVVDDLEGLPRVDPDRRRSAATRRRIALVAGVLAAVLLIGMVGSVWLRSATVRVTLKRQPVASEVLFGVRTEGVEQVNGATFMVDGNPVSFESTYRTTVPVTGTVTEQTAPATGQLQLRNITDEDVVIPAGTGIATREGIRYRTVSDAELKAGSTERPSEGSVAIESVTGGDGANIEAGKLVGLLEGYEGVYYANLEAPVAGGEGRSTPGVSAEDSDAIVALARAELDKQAANATVDGGARVVPSTLEPEGEMTFTLDHEVGAPAESLTIDARMTYRALAVDPVAVVQQADATLRSNLAANVPAGYELDPGSVMIGAADGVPGGEAGLMRVTATAEARATLDDTERDQLADAMSGKSQGEAREAALANGDVADLTISVDPSWLTDSLPSAGRIKVTAT